MRRDQAKEVLTFAIISLGTLLADLALFKAGTLLGLIPFFANLLSSSAAAIVLYFIAAKHSFQRRRTITGGIATLIWYTISTLIWSSAIELISNQLQMDALVAKIATIPGSFLLNYLVTKSLANSNLNRQTKARGHAN